MTSYIAFCLYLMNKMRGNLIKIRSCTTFKWFNWFDRLCIELFKFHEEEEEASSETQGADSGGEGKSKRAKKYGTKKSKERREEPLGTMSYQTRSKRSPPFCLLIGARKLFCFIFMCT